MKFKFYKDIIGFFLFAIWIIIRILNKFWLGDTKLDIIGYVAVLIGWFFICSTTKPLPRWLIVIRNIWLTILTLGTIAVIYDTLTSN